MMREKPRWSNTIAVQSVLHNLSDEQKNCLENDYFVILLFFS